MSLIQYARRELVRRPGPSFVVVILLALGIGATTAMFSLFHHVLMQPLPVPAPERLVNLGAPGPKPGSTSCSDAGDCQQVFSYPMFLDLEARQSVFAGLAAHRGFEASLSYGGETSAGTGTLVSGSYFAVLGLQPALGRLITPRDEPRVDEGAIVVLSYDYWQGRFGGDPTVVGSALTVNGRSLTVVGVTPAGFSGTTVGARPQVFVPLTMRWLMQPTAPREHVEERRAYWLYLFARLAPDIESAQAAARINGLYGGILAEVEAPLHGFLSDEEMRRFLQRQITVAPGMRGQSDVPERARQPLTLLLGATALVLLIVCVNIANLLLARGASRAKEMAIRASIGAGRRQLLSQLLLEAAALAAIGGALSVPVAALTLSGITAMLPAQLGAGLDTDLSEAAFLFAAGTSLLTVLLFATLPAVQAARTDPGIVMKAQSSQSLGGRALGRLRSTLAIAQIAFSTILLVLAGLFAQSLANVARVDLGMAVDSLVTFSVSPQLSGYTAERAMALFDRLESELAALPGVTDVAAASVPLITDSNSRNSLSVEGFEGGPGIDTDASTNEVSSGFFRTLSIPMLAGRDFTVADRSGAPRVAIVNQSFVRKFNLGPDAVGKRFGFGWNPGDFVVEIVGVVADAKYSMVKDDIPPQYFLPRRQIDDIPTLSFYVRADLDPARLLRSIPEVVSSIDPGVPVSDLMTMRETVGDNVYLDEMIAILSAGFAALATLLAAIGLYGVLAYGVAQRTRELGMRLALGATPGRLRAMVLKQVGVMALLGGVIGLAGAVALGRAAESLLFGLSGYDPLVLLATVAVLSTVVFGAGYLPARRASSIAPMEALRNE